MTEPTDDFFIALDQTQVSLVALVLHQAAEECRAVDTTPDIPAEDRSVVTLGRVATRWAGIAEREEYCDVVNVHGERLYNVSLSLEEWYQVRAALSEYAARLTLTRAHPPTVDDNRRRAREALLLVDRITEVTSG
ncbi:hypothetical protein AB0I49_37125 [Streptomyces sp. NPDC050617]|uniref:hypothetical protein n=1 Tax=Streptomyces sp. NPDC050617 TaxID=3154628 RepID=UPI0034372A48